MDYLLIDIKWKTNKINVLYLVDSLETSCFQLLTKDLASSPASLCLRRELTVLPIPVSLFTCNGKIEQ